MGVFPSKDTSFPAYHSCQESMAVMLEYVGFFFKEIFIFNGIYLFVFICYKYFNVPRIVEGRMVLTHG